MRNTQIKNSNPTLRVWLVRTRQPDTIGPPSNGSDPKNSLRVKSKFSKDKSNQEILNKDNWEIVISCQPSPPLLSGLIESEKSSDLRSTIPLDQKKKCSNLPKDTAATSSICTLKEK
jgi:hypothetical protein